MEEKFSKISNNNNRYSFLHKKGDKITSPMLYFSPCLLQHHRERIVMNDTTAEQHFSSPTPGHLQRIVIVGVAGAGKTTLAQHLARHLGLPHVELDALFWDANWTQTPRHIFRERVTQALNGERWVTDGNYSTVRDLTWGRADTVLWLDYSLGTILTRLIWRTLRRSFTREELWNGNRERLVGSLLARDSILRWALKTYPKKRKRYLAALDDPTWTHLAIVRLRTPQATQSWLSRLPKFSNRESVGVVGKLEADS
jgi:adenylate kinase family enzyme